MAKRATKLKAVSSATQVSQDRKSWTRHDLLTIKPKTKHQQDVFDAWASGKHLLLHGYAGTGKSFIALYLALYELFSNEDIEKIVIIRSAVPSREVGFTPGTLEEKNAVYEMPYAGIFDELFPWRKAYENLKKCGKVEFHNSSFLRGTTINNAIIIVDECQSQTFHELSTIITRVGDCSRIVFCGDERQNDLICKKTDVSGFPKFKKILERMPSMALVGFDHPDDIVRSGLVKEFILTSDIA
jgi:phosphate starvation-inducible PhoH-like protein